MRRSLVLVGLILATASCGGPSPRGGGGDDAESSPGMSNTVTTDMAVEETPSAPPTQSPMQQRAASGPNVGPTAAPGVAFNYRYAFRLEAQRIAAVQERHAAMCEQLGINRCRITGMLYRVRNETDIEARLSFKLDPSIARVFGREGVGVVTQNEGMLVESEISGTDVGTRIRQAGRSIAQLQEDLARVEARLAANPRAGDKSNLEYEAQQLRQQIRAMQENRQDAEETLATTPMAFVYGSGDLVPGFDTRRPVRDSLEQAGRNFIDGVSILFILLVTLLPWIVVGLLGWWAVRAINRRREAAGARRAAKEEAAAPV